MGLTLIAVLTAALLLPGIIAAWFFYREGTTGEVDAVLPALSTPEGIAQLGLFSVFTHSCYATVLALVAALPDITGLPLANPYLPFMISSSPRVGLDEIWALITGTLLLCAVAIPCGMLPGRLVYAYGDRSVFYGPLTQLIEKGDGPRRFITAYVLSKASESGRMLGYQGTVKSLVRGADRLPGKLVLQDASVFSLTITSHGTVRRENARRIDWITLSAEDWHNVAFRVFELGE